MERTTFVIREQPEPPAIGIQVNFGVAAGREVTAAEIDDLAGWLLDEVPGVSVISEQRHEIGGVAQALVHVVRVELAWDQAPADDHDRAELEARVFGRVRYWLDRCIADRHGAAVDAF